jgi:hypothetical protein
VVPGIRSLLTQLHAEVDGLEAAVVPTWEGLVHPLERIVDRLSRAWGTVTHLKAVKDTDELRKVSGHCALGAALSEDTWWGLLAVCARESSTARQLANILRSPPCLCLACCCIAAYLQAYEEVQPERVKLSLRLSQVRIAAPCSRR